MNSSVTCVIQVILDTRADTYFNAFMNIISILHCWETSPRKSQRRPSKYARRIQHPEKMQRQVGMSDLGNAVDQGKETNSKHESRLHPCKTV